MNLPQNWLSKAAWMQFQEEETNAHRIYTSGDSYMERFGDDFLISLTKDENLPTLIEELRKWCEEMGFVPRRIFYRELVKNPTEKNTPALIKGDANLPLNSIVQENRVFYEIDFGASYSVGLFIDQRENRKYLKNLKPKKILNCFSYTGSFSLVGALAGGETVSIDVAKPALERCKKNFELNQLSTEHHRFIVDDVRKVLPRLAKRREKFDAIILDPPTFSRTKEGGVFKFEQDFPDLIKMAIQCAAPDAHILLSTNSRNVSTEKLTQIAKRIIPKAKFLTLPPPIDIPSSAMPSTVWLSLK